MLTIIKKLQIKLSQEVLFLMSFDANNLSSLHITEWNVTKNNTDGEIVNEKSFRNFSRASHQSSVVTKVLLQLVKCK